MKTDDQTADNTNSPRTMRAIAITVAVVIALDIAVVAVVVVVAVDVFFSSLRSPPG